MTTNADMDILKDVVESIHDAIISIDHSGIIRFVNAEARILLHQIGDPVGQPLEACFRGELLDNESLPFLELIRSRSTFLFKRAFEHGSVQYFEASVYPSTAFITIMSKDITARKYVETEINDNHQKLLLLVNAAQDLLSHQEPKQLLDNLFLKLSNELGLDVYFNYLYDKVQNRLRLMNYFGIEEEQAESIRWLDIGEAVCGTVAQDRSRMVCEDIPSMVDEKVDLIKTLGIQAYACHPLMSYGKLIGTLSFGSKTKKRFTVEELDLIQTICNQVAKTLERTFLVAELKKTNDQLSTKLNELTTSETKFRMIFDGAMDGILLTDDEGNIVDSNPASLSLIGIEKKALVNKNLRKLIDPSDLKKFDRYLETLQEKGSCHGEIRIVSPGAKGVMVGFSATKGIYPDHHIVIVRDISMQKKLEASLINAKTAAEKASKAKTDFLSMMSHELRTPLNSIIGFSQILLEDTSLLPNQIDRTMKILNSSRHLLKLINEILYLVRFESNVPLKMAEPHEIKSYIDESISIVSNLAQMNHITILNRVNSSASVKVVCEPHRMKQIFNNLLSNAIKYNKTYGTVTIDYDIHLEENFLCLTVTDTGIGIPEEEYGKIFRPFYRIYHPDNNIEGTGIGLTLVKQIVSDMGGAIGVRSRVGEGSTFWIQLPMCRKTLQTIQSNGV